MVQALPASLVKASLVAVLGIEVLFRFRPRRADQLWGVAGVFLLSACAGAASMGRAMASGQVDSLDLLDLFSVVWFSSMAGTFSKLVDLKADLGAVEFALPRRWPREMAWSGIALGVMGVLIVACSLRLAAPYGAAIGAIFAGWGYLTARHGGKAEFRRGGLQLGGRVYPWAGLGKFEWRQHDDGSPILRIQAGGGSHLLLCWPEDPVLEAVLIRHGLQP
jgi:hypothetical protein